MARMIPANEENNIEPFGERSVYIALKDNLPDDYTVFYSFKWSKKRNRSRIKWGEADFTIFHPKYGILVIEVKGGGISLEEGQWYYNKNGVLTPMRDPMEQANRTRFELKDLIEEKLPENQYCWLQPVVWFPSIKDRSILTHMPPSYHPEIVFMEWALSNTKKAIDSAYKFYESEKHTNLSSESAKIIINTMAPAFQAFQSMHSKHSEQEYVFLRLTDEQNGLIEYLDEQREATIQGSAGTGKTLLAIEKAKRLAKDGTVLFLCFNRFLMEELNKGIIDHNIKIFNLPSLVKSQLNLPGIPNNDQISEFLEHPDTLEAWPFDHIIIDEGQDFLNDHLDSLSLIAEEKKGAFYVFYDKHQLVQKFGIPDSLINAECRLVLRRNCRNTASIANTSVSPLEIDAVPWERLPVGSKPNLHLSKQESVLRDLEKLILRYIEDIKIKAEKIAVLTLKTEENSILTNIDRIGRVRFENSKTENRVLFTTVRKFKGLEADVVVLIDVDSKTFEDHIGKNLFYVGASRAKHFLDIFTISDEDDLREMARNLTGAEGKRYLARILKFLKVNSVK